MGLGDNRRSPKMSRKIRQRKKHDRLKRRRAATAPVVATKAKPAAKPKAAPAEKKAKKSAS